MRRRLRVGGFLVLLAAGAVLAWSLSGLWSPARPDGASQVFHVGPGESLRSVALRLQAEHLLPERVLFGPRVVVAFARVAGIDHQIKSGEYDVAPSLTPIEILERLVSGSVKTYAVTLPEGLRLDEIGARMEEVGVTTAEDLLERARDPSFVAELGIEAETLEGYLYPETYRFRRNTPSEAVLRTMVEQFRAAWTEEDRELLKRSGMSLHQVLVLASIVEKETGVPEERPRIAAVFHNRLRRGMRLQSDPTVIYGVLHTRGTFDGNIRWRDLRTDTPYNTYTRSGLPPGPIASVSMAAVRAVLDPEDVSYIYFVSRNDGTHVFSVTLAEHNRAVQRYQKRHN